MNTTRIQVGDHVFYPPLAIEGDVVFLNRETNRATVRTETEDGLTEMTTLPLSHLTVVFNEKKEVDEVTDKNEWWNWVRDFQVAFGHPAPESPTMLTKERIEKRNSWMLEECEEMLEAETLEDQVDAAIDKLYFALGDLVELGVMPHNLLQIVQNANMGKLHEIDGKMVPVYKEDGKVKKPDDWEERFAPETKLKAEIERQSKNK